MDQKKNSLGIELGSTRIKAVVIDQQHIPVASGSFDWENSLVNGIWTYPMEEVRRGLTACYAALKQNYEAKFGEKLTSFGAMGVSAMMHGYLPFDQQKNQLAEFRTWRNTITGPAAAELTQKFDFNVPQRWSIAHLYQAMLNGEEHLERLDHLTTLAGYIHYLLTGVKTMGVGDASGMFPIDSTLCDYDPKMMEIFDELIEARGYRWRIRDILPRVCRAGEFAGELTKEGALLLDPTGDLQSGIPVAPCEGDVGTGMAATNSVELYTGNVSAGTSDFAMIVVDHKLAVHREIDMVTTPDGLPVAMVHCNNCTSDINAWASLFAELLEMNGVSMSRGKLLDLMFEKAKEGEPDCGGLLSYNYYSGEGVTDIDEGRPILARTPNAKFTFANLMRTQLYAALATLKIGLDILTNEEKIRIDKLYGHGGFFKAPVVGQKMLSAAVGAPVSVMETAGEGGPYGMAILAAYALYRDPEEKLGDYLKNRVFAQAKDFTVMADQSDIDGFERYVEQYKASFELERVAVKTMKA